MKKVDVGLIGGTGTETTLSTTEHMRIGTPYGLALPIFIGDIGEITIAFLHVTAPTIVFHRTE